MESSDGLVIGVQFHPELLDTPFQKIFTELIKRSSY
jgi:hypothetical protein